MRIALVCPYAWDDPGGVQVHVRELTEYLLGRGHDAVVLAPARGRVTQPYVRPIGRPVDVRYNASNAPIDPRPWHRGRVRDTLRRFRPDVVHVHEPLTPSTSMWAVLEARAPVVATFHAASSRSLLFDAARPVLRRIAARIAVRIAVSESAAAFVRARLGGRFEIVPNGTEVSRFAGARPADLGPGRKLLFVGRLEGRKGFPVALAGFARLAATRPDLRLVVVGGGPQGGMIDRLAPELRARVDAVGAVAHETLPTFHAACDVFVAPALGGESFGMVLVEAMAAGLPVVASDIDGYRDVVRANVDGILVPPGDPDALADGVARVLDDPSVAGRLRVAGPARAAGYDWAIVGGRLEEIYAEVAGSGSPVR